MSSKPFNWYGLLRLAFLITWFTKSSWFSRSYMYLRKNILFSNFGGNILGSTSLKLWDFKICFKILFLFLPLFLHVHFTYTDENRQFLADFFSFPLQKSQFSKIWFMTPRCRKAQIQVGYVRYSFSVFFSFFADNAFSSLFLHKVFCLWTK